MGGKLRKLLDELSDEELYQQITSEIDAFLDENRAAYDDLLGRVYFDDTGRLYIVDVDATPPRAYKNEEDFLEDLAQVFREDYGFNASQSFLEASGKNVHILLSHYL